MPIITKTVVRIKFPVAQWNVIDNCFERKSLISSQSSGKQLLCKHERWVTNSRERGNFDWINLVLNQALKLETEGFRDICH